MNISEVLTREPRNEGLLPQEKVDQLAAVITMAMITEANIARERPELYIPPKGSLPVMGLNEEQKIAWKDFIGTDKNSSRLEAVLRPKTLTEKSNEIKISYTLDQIQQETYFINTVRQDDTRLPFELHISPNQNKLIWAFRHLEPEEYEDLQSFLLKTHAHDNDKIKNKHNEAIIVQKFLSDPLSFFSPYMYATDYYISPKRLMSRDEIDDYREQMSSLALVMSHLHRVGGKNISYSNFIRAVPDAKWAYIGNHEGLTIERYYVSATGEIKEDSLQRSVPIPVGSDGSIIGWTMYRQEEYTSSAKGYIDKNPWPKFFHPATLMNEIAFAEIAYPHKKD